MARGEHPFKIQRGSLKWQVVMKLALRQMTRAELTRSCMSTSEVVTKAMNELTAKGIVIIQDELCSLTEAARHSFRKSIAEHSALGSYQQAAPANFKALQPKNMASPLGTRPGSNDYRKWPSKG